MEVHSHSHTERKKWTHYLWEFLMLFLAVFSGFMAENYREHVAEGRRATRYGREQVAEGKRAKKYALNVVDDMKRDTVMIGVIIRQLNGYVKVIDSLASYAR